jgi:hypothetical protein
MRTSWLIAALALAGCSSIVSGKLDEKPSSSATDASVVMDAAVATDASNPDASLSDASPADAAVECADEDGDGFFVGDVSCGSTQDCDDNDSNIYPGAPETCDGVDSDCDSVRDLDEVVNTWPDRDGDGFGFGVSGVFMRMTCDEAREAGRIDNNRDCLDVGDGAYCVNPLFPQSPTTEGGCSNNPADYPTVPYDRPSGGTSWDYNCDGIVEKQHAENISCLEPANDEMCDATPGTVACSDAVGILDTAECGDSVTVWACRGEAFCAIGPIACRDSQYSSRMGCR